MHGSNGLVHTAPTIQEVSLYPENMVTLATRNIKRSASNTLHVV